MSASWWPLDHPISTPPNPQLKVTPLPHFQVTHWFVTKCLKNGMKFPSAILSIFVLIVPRAGDLRWGIFASLYVCLSHSRISKKARWNIFHETWQADGASEVERAIRFWDKSRLDSESRNLKKKKKIYKPILAMVNKKLEGLHAFHSR